MTALGRAIRIRMLLRAAIDAGDLATAAHLAHAVIASHGGLGIVDRIAYGLWLASTPTVEIESMEANAN